MGLKRLDFKILKYILTLNNQSRSITRNTYWYREAVHQCDNLLSDHVVIWLALRTFSRVAGIDIGSDLFEVSEDSSYSRGRPRREKTEGSSIVSSISSSSLMNSQSLSSKIDNVSTIVWQGSVLTTHSLHRNRPPQVGLQKPLAKGNHPLAWYVVNDDVFFLWGELYIVQNNLKVPRVVGLLNFQQVTVKWH